MSLHKIITTERRKGRKGEGKEEERGEREGEGKEKERGKSKEEEVGGGTEGEALFGEGFLDLTTYIFYIC
ncbi:hypothetical protein, partial [Bacillus tropicus]|uniref:hypothetical protein n=1 Tax=Bacillus tropicus TaxID=2026188 RepID=UPI00284FF8B3